MRAGPGEGGRSKKRVEKLIVAHYFESLDNGRSLKPQNTGQFQKLDHIHAPMAAFQPGNERLISPKGIGELGLR